MFDFLKYAYKQIKLRALPPTLATVMASQPRIISLSKTIEQLFITFLKIILILFIIYYLFGIYHWIGEKEYGLVIQPFETSNIGEGSDGKPLSKGDELDGKPLAALLRFDLQGINDTWSKSINKKISENMILRDTSNYSFPDLGIKNEALDYSISSIGSMNLEGSSLSLGSIFFSMKELSGNRASTISCSLQRYNSTILVVAILDDHHLPDKTIRIFQAKRILYHNSSMIEQIPDLIDDLAYQLSLDISKRWASRTEDLPQSWQAFKYLTQGRDAYIDYQIKNNLNDLDNATNLTFKAIKFEPSWKRSSDLLSNLGFSYLESKEYGRAEHIFLTLPTSDFNRSLGLGLVYGCLGEKIRSLNELENATRLNKYSAIAWYNKGVALDKLGNYSESIQSYENATNQKQNYTNAWYNKGCALSILCKYDDAIKAYDEALKVNPTFADAWANKGNAFCENSEYNEAIKAYDKAIELDPNIADYWYGKGYVLEKQKNYDEAIKAYDKAIELEPAYEEVWCDKGGALRELGKYDEAIKAYDEVKNFSDKAMEIDPQLAEAWADKGDALSKEGKYDEAMKAYDKAIKLNSTYAEAWAKKGKALDSQGKYDEAIEAYDEAIQLDPNYAMAWNNKGKALDSQGKYDEAIEAYDEAIQLDPNYAEARSNKGIAFISQGKYNEAIEALRAFP